MRKMYSKGYKEKVYEILLYIYIDTHTWRKNWEVVGKGLGCGDLIEGVSIVFPLSRKNCIGREQVWVDDRIGVEFGI